MASVFLFIVPPSFCGQGKPEILWDGILAKAWRAVNGENGKQKMEIGRAQRAPCAPPALGDPCTKPTSAKPSAMTATNRETRKEKPETGKYHQAETHITTMPQVKKNREA